MIDKDLCIISKGLEIHFISGMDFIAIGEKLIIHSGII